MISARRALPIFPLGTVLFPGGLLPLRIFEARYMDMVRRAMRENSEFGVCLIRKGHEVAERGVETETIGCRARIDDWNMEQLGVLQIATTGTERFEIVSHVVQDDGLMLAEVEAIEPEAFTPLPDGCAACAALLERIVAQWEAGGAQVHPAAHPAPHAAPHAAPAASSGAASDLPEVRRPPIARPYRFDDATWVGNRLSEVLPISLPARQKLMALTDGLARLTIVQKYLEQHGIL